MLWRLAARFVTGPVAFFLAAVVDITALAATALRVHAAKRLRLRRD